MGLSIYHHSIWVLEKKSLILLLDWRIGLLWETYPLLIGLFWENPYRFPILGVCMYVLRTHRYCTYVIIISIWSKHYMKLLTMRQIQQRMGRTTKHIIRHHLDCILNRASHPSKICPCLFFIGRKKIPIKFFENCPISKVARPFVCPLKIDI